MSRTRLALALAAVVVTVGGCGAADAVPVAGARSAPQVTEATGSSVELAAEAFTPTETALPSPVTAETPAPSIPAKATESTAAPEPAAVVQPAPASAQVETRTGFDWSTPAYVGIATGADLIVAEHPTGSVGCEGAPRLAFWVQGQVSGSAVLASEHEIETGGVFSVIVDNGRIAWTEFCDGGTSGMFSAELNEDGSLYGVREVPFPIPPVHGQVGYEVISIDRDGTVRVFLHRSGAEAREVVIPADAASAPLPATCPPDSVELFSGISDGGFIIETAEPLEPVRVAICASAAGEIAYFGLDLTTGYEIRLDGCVESDRRTWTMRHEYDGTATTYQVIDNAGHELGAPGRAYRTTPNGEESMWNLWLEVSRNVGAQERPDLTMCAG